MKDLAEMAESDNPHVAFWDGINTTSILDWDDESGHPYFWPWADDIFREQVIACLVDSAKRQTDYAGKDMLRWLFFKWRTAQRRKRHGDMPDDFRAYRWTWATHAEVTADTFLSEDQIRRAVDRLEARGLVCVVLDSRLRWVPHYRPSLDLFRVAQTVTMLTNGDVARDYQRELDPSRTKFESEEYLRAFFAVVRRGPLLDMIRDFAKSDAPDRADTFVAAFGEATKSAVQHVLR